MTSADEKSLALRKWIFAGLMVAAGVLLSPMFSFPLGVTKAFPLQHMINIFLAVLCGTRYGTAAAFGTSLIRNLLGTGSLLAFPGSSSGLFSPATSTATRTSSGLPSSENSSVPPSSGAPPLTRSPPSSWARPRRLLLRLPLRRLLRRRLRHRLRRSEGHESDSNRILQNLNKIKTPAPSSAAGFLWAKPWGLKAGMSS